MSFTVPLLKDDSIYGRSVNVEDFRGISISPFISKVLEHCIIERFSEFLNTTDNHFGFKNQLGCSHVIYSVPRAIYPPGRRMQPPPPKFKQIYGDVFSSEHAIFCASSA